MEEKADMCDKMIELAKKHNSKNSDSKDKLQKRKEYEAIAAQLQQLKEKKELEEKRRKEEKENQEKIKRERIVELSKKGVGYITEEEARLIGKEKEWNDLIDSIIDNFPYCYIPAKDDCELFFYYHYFSLYLDINKSFSSSDISSFILISGSSSFDDKLK